jgi:hypothetical protein
LDPEDDPLAKIFVPPSATGKLVQIPKELHSFSERGPFRKCSACSVDLLKGCTYEIQKVYRDREVIFEMALCMTCGEGLSKEFSEESMEALKGFLLSSFRPSEDSCHCHFCGYPRPLTTGYTLVGTCRSQSLLMPALVLCQACGDKLQNRLSRKTREAQDDFIRQNFPGVPADLDMSPVLGGLP